MSEDLNLDLIRVPTRKKSGATFPWPGWAPIHVAAWRNNATIVRLLIEHGADVNCLTEHQQVYTIDLRCKRSSSETSPTVGTIAHRRSTR